jgi:SET domain-containing protein
MSAADVDARPSPIAGHGLFARRDFAAGERIAPYLGVLTRHAPDPAATGGKVFSLEIATGLWLDGSTEQNLARFANHACDPNAELTWAGPDEGAWLTALRPLSAGVEITFDYGFSLADSLAHPCHCGHPECPGRIIAGPLRSSLRRHLRFSRPRD